jgi:hypothetical protein
MRLTSKVFMTLSLLTSTALAGPGTPGGRPAGAAEVRTEGRISRAVQTTMKTDLVNSGVAKDSKEAERLVDGYVRAGLPEMKADTIRNLKDRSPEAKASVNALLGKMTNTVVNAKAVTALGENGKLVLEAASKMATSVVETISNDTAGTVDLVKINDVATMIESVSSRSDLGNEGVLLIKINEINAKLGNGRTIRDLKDCF